MKQHTNTMSILVGLNRNSVLSSCDVCVAAPVKGQPELGNDAEGNKMDEVDEDF